MKVLVTGATGFIGRAVAQLLIERGDEVRALVRPDSETSMIDGLEVERRTGDVTDRGSVARAARGAEAVIHTAAWVSLHSRRLEDMRRVNVTGVEHVASAALEVGARRVVHVSSIVAVGATPRGTPVDESLPWPFEGTDIAYLATKREGELTAFRYARPDMGVVVVNPCLVIGAPDPRGVDPGNILKFLRRKLVFRVDGGANFIDVWDVARGIVAALDRGRSGERYILGNENLTFAELYALLEEVSGVSAPRFAPPFPLLYGLASGLERLEQWTGLEPPINRQLMWLARWKWFADPGKARRELGLPSTPVRESLAAAIDYYRAHDMV